MNVQRIPFTGELSDTFFEMVPPLYVDLPFSLQEETGAVRKLFELEAIRNDIVLYTDQQEMRLVGIFPKESDEAHFGFWETTNNPTLNKEAFMLLEADARLSGKTSLSGPLNFNTFNPYRLRLGDIPSWIVFDREPVNPVYYPAIIEALGYRVKSTFESRFTRKEDMPAVLLDKQPFVEKLKNLPFDFIRLNPYTWQQYEEEIFMLVHEIFCSNPAYKPVSKEQFSLFYNLKFAKKLCPYSSVMFRARDTGKLVAISFCHPNYQSLNLPASVSPALEHDFPRLQKKVLLVKTVGVHPHYRQQGLMTFLGAHAALSFNNLYEEVIFCLMRSDNYSTHFTDDLPYEAAQYALYSKQL